MSWSDDLIKRAVAELKGHRPRIGAICATESDSLSMQLVRYEDDGETCVLEWEGEHKRPASEVFDVNMLKDRCFEMRAEQIRNAAAVAANN